MSLTITFRLENAGSIALILEAKAASERTSAKGSDALWAVAAAVRHSSDGKAQVAKDEARRAHPLIVEIVEAGFRGHELDGDLDDLTEVVLQIQGQFRLAFTMRDAGSIETVFVGTGPAHHRLLASVALEASAIDALWEADGNPEVPLDLEEVAAKARSESTAALIASMPGEVRHGLEAVRAAIAALGPQGSATVSLR